MAKEKVSITLDSEVIERVKEIAEIEDRSFSQCVNMILKRYIKAVEKKMNK
ncbi:MAG: toxin-antitoxin system protein [Clostridia bacterium]|nr:toxin-antitoxin system protein [Clostridia bacterium]